MNFQQFQYVLAVVDWQNFELAAEKCHVTQSTLSTMIGRLEEEIGIKIFNRKTKPVSITDEGLQLTERLRIILNEIDALNNLVQELKGEMAGELRIGVIPTIAPYLLPLFLTDFAARFPKVKMIVKEMTTAQIKKALKIRNIDVGILAIPLDDSELVELPLYSEPFLVYDCTGEPQKTKATIDGLDYSKLCLLQEGHCLRTQVQKICELSDLFSKSDANIEIESGSMGSLLRITKIRKGITVIPHLASLDLPEEDACKLVEFESPVPVRRVGLITHKFFVKQKLLLVLQKMIIHSTNGMLPEQERGHVLSPV